MKRILTLVLAVMLVLLVAVACTKPEEPHTHSATKTEQVDATCTAAGVKAYWYCAGCATYFSDEACTAKIDSLDAWKTGAGKIAIKAHTATKTEQVDATATTDGVKAYWTCSVCKACFSDAACTTKIDNLDAWKTGDGKIPATGEAPEAPKNEGTLKAGIYKSSFSVAMGQMTMNFNITLTMKADGTFAMTDAAGADKGSGTWALTGDCYTLTFAADKTTTCVVKANGSLEITSRLHYGSNGFDIASVEGGITFTFDQELPAPHTHSATKTEQVDATATTDGVKAYWYCAGCGTYFSDEACTAVIENLDAWKTGDGKIPATGTPAVSYTLAAGTYVGTYEKNIAAMGMSVTYYYNATFNADGTFNYFVKYIMGGVQDGVNISGTYAVEGNTVTLTPAEGAAITGTLTADNTLSIALQATTISTTAYDVTFTAGDHVIPELPPVADYTLAAGTYVGTYEKNIEAMGMSVTYYYNATFNADGTFNYFVKYIMMGSVQDGVNISGTYAVEGNTVTLTPAEGTAITGTLTADNTLAIALQATAMSTTAYDVTFTAGDHVIPEIPVVPPVDPNPEAGDDDMADDEFAPAF